MASLESVYGESGGKEGTACKMNLRPLLKPLGELERNFSARDCGGETRFWFGELAFTTLVV